MRSEPVTRGWRQLLAELGALRLMLYLGVLILLVLRPAPGTPPITSGWEMIPTLVAPALMPLFVMVLLLDALMAAVLHASRPEARRRYRLAIGADLIATLSLVLWWWAYFRAIFPG